MVKTDTNRRDLSVELANGTPPPQGKQEATGVSASKFVLRTEAARPQRVAEVDTPRLASAVCGFPPSATAATNPKVSLSPAMARLSRERGERRRAALLQRSAELAASFGQIRSSLRLAFPVRALPQVGHASRVSTTPSSAAFLASQMGSSAPDRLH